MSSPPSHFSVGRTFARSPLGTLFVMLGGAILLAGGLYGVALGLTELLSRPSVGPTPAGNGNPLGWLVPVLLSGTAFVVLGGQLIGYAR